MVTTIIIPKSYDPVSAPKMFTLILVVATALLFSNSSFLTRNNLDLLSKVAIAFIILLLVNLLINHTAFPERLFGVSGRSTGFLTLAAFAILFLISRSTIISTQTLLVYISIANVLVSLYFTMQIFGYDFGNYQEYYGAPSSTLGNPNFVSGFLGFSSVALLDLGRRLANRRQLSFLLITPFLLNLWVIIKTDSIQGIISLALALFVYLLCQSYLTFSQVNFFKLSPIFAIPALLVALGFFGAGPLATLLSSTTVFSRLDYWRASVSMLMSNPLAGVGLDAYGDNYRHFRDQQAISRFGESQVTDSAHNVYLDMFSYGGLPLGLTYLALNLVPVLTLLLRLKTLKMQEDKRNQIVLLALWFGFQLQTLVSVNQIGVSVWIWIILALMSSNADADAIQHSKSNPQLVKTSLVLRLSVFFVSTSMAVMSFLPVKKNIDFLAAANRADGLAMKNLVQEFPQDSKLIALVATGFQGSNYSTLALTILNQGVLHNPNSFTLWKLIYQNPNTSVVRKNEALTELKRIDPRFPYPSQ
jgi:O-antigen ligase